MADPSEPRRIDDEAPVAAAGSTAGPTPAAARRRREIPHRRQSYRLGETMTPIMKSNPSPTARVGQVNKATLAT